MGRDNPALVNYWTITLQAVSTQGFQAIERFNPGNYVSGGIPDGRNLASQVGDRVEDPNCPTFARG
jgi:hypothetical protein